MSPPGQHEQCATILQEMRVSAVEVEHVAVTAEREGVPWHAHIG